MNRSNEPTAPVDQRPTMPSPAPDIRRRRTPSSPRPPSERDTIPAPSGYPAMLDPELAEGLRLDDQPPLGPCPACERGRCRRCEP